MLKGPPSQDHLSRLYHELSRIGASCAGSYRRWPYGKPDYVRLLVLASEMLRYDPRLMTILVQYCLCHFREINPTAIRGFYAEIETPQVWAVITEFVKVATDEKEAIYWAEYLQQGLRPAPLQFLYHYLYLPGSHLAQRAVETGLWEYKKWGFLACERPTIDERNKKTAGSLDRNSRLNVLRKLIKEKGKISLTDYMTALDHSISRQQALIDLKSIPGIVCKGHGRGANWRL